jgi:8-amino-7-oxononanoate synthase
VSRRPYTGSHPIAVVGIGCRFPDADDAEGYWNNIVRGRTSFTEIPRERWDHEAFANKNQRAIDKTWTTKGSFLRNVDQFPALHFGIAPRRLEVMDPQQRLLIEATRVAIQDAGYEGKRFDRSRTGVYVGMSVSEFKNIVSARVLAMQIASGEFGPAAGTQDLRDALMEMTENVVPMRAFTLPGSLTALCATAISQTFDFGGPSFTLDAACASASVAIHDAVLQLRSGQIDSALAGGCYVNLTPDNLIAFTRIGAISPSGACRPFDASADGFVQSDGVGMVFLKRLEDALADGDRIYALIRGSGCNNDGRGEGPMTPRVDGQLRALRAAYKDAGCSPASVAYFEAHGTATAVGDPVEIEALGTLLTDAGVFRDRPARVGSVKGNIGHAMAAAGIAGFVKALKVIQHRTAPPQAGYETPNPLLAFDRWPLKVSSRSEALEPRDGSPLRVAVSSFGFGGTNSHILLEEPPARERPAIVAVSAELPEAVILSAPTEELLVPHLLRVAEALEHGTLARASLADIAHTLNARRRFERVRAVIGARSRKDLLDNLRKAAAGERSPHVWLHDVGPEPRAPKLALLFPGQGAQRVGLLEPIARRFPIFREKLEALSSAVDGLLEKPLTAYVHPSREAIETLGLEALEASLKQTEVCQPVMAALGLALAHLLREAKVAAHVSLGHSLGEFAALANAGVMDEKHAVRFVAERGLAMRALPLSDPGTMAAVMADADTTRRVIAGIEGVWIANLNHPRQVTISGTHAGVERAVERLRAEKIEARPLSVSHAFHTPLLEGVRAASSALLDRIPIHAPKHAVASCIAESPYGADIARARSTMAAHAAAPVDFVRGLEQAKAAGANVFVQVGAGSMLTAFARSTLEGSTTVTLSSTEDDGGYELLRGVATLAALGAPVDFEALYKGEGRRVVEIPETPLERQSYWPVKTKQPRAVLDHPLPEGERPSVRLVNEDKAKASDMSSETRDKKTTEANSEALVKLFVQQAEIIRVHAEIIREQTRALSGGATLPSSLPALEALTPISRAEPTPERTESRSHPVQRAAAILDEGTAVARVEPLPRARPSAPVTGDVRDRVFEIVARISAFPKESLRGEQKLVDELGFDSLMVADLGGAIDSAFPNLGALPPSLFSMTTTVADVASHVAKALTRPSDRREAQPPEKSSPVARHRVLAAKRARRALAGRELFGQVWLVTTGASDLGRELTVELEQKGARVLTVALTAENGASTAALALAHGRTNTWPSAQIAELPDAIQRSGIRLDGFLHASLSSSDNPILELHPLAARLEVSRFVVLTALGGHLGLAPAPSLGRNLAQAALLGYAKSLARERPNLEVRAIDLDPSVSAATNAQWIVAEMASGDVAVEVGFDGRDRFIAELAPSEASGSSRSIGPSDVVLITGGAGEIGAAVAKHVASKGPKALILVGRRQADPSIEQLVAELSKSAPTHYVSADATRKEEIARAARIAPAPVTVAIHAAGLIEDAPASKKSQESIERVMNAKVLGARALLEALPQLKDVILFSSWAGRFGNAGQTDYSAANELLDHLAISASSGARRVVSIAWPPWSSTRMVKSIPTAVQRALAAEGVTFLEEREGIEALEAIVASGAWGVELVGRTLPRFETRVEHVERFSDERHPYLADHKLKNRPVVPLASTTDLIAFAAGVEPSDALIIEELELVRGLMGGDAATVSGSIRTFEPSRREARIEVKTSPESVAYRARVIASDPRGVALPALELSGVEEPQALDLDAFYREHTFHGPMLRGIERVERMTASGIAGLIRTSKPSAWLPRSDRRAWAVDPLVVDGSFQLAAYWAQIHLGRAGYPIGFDRLTLLRPFSGERVRAKLQLHASDQDTFAGTIVYETEDGQPIGALENVRARFMETKPVASSGNGHAPSNGHTNGKSSPAVDVPEETYNIALFPEYEALDQRFQMAELIGLKNPYFHVHSGTARNTSVVDGVEMLNFSSYNYLGFSGHPEVVAAAKEAIDRYGTSVSASRVASGERPLHRDLEEGIARHVGVEDSVVFVSGHATNVTTIGHLFDRNDLILHDALIHDSILQGIYLSGATRRPFPHGDLGALERILAQVRKNYRRVLLCAEGIYSMDGDACDLPGLIDLKKRYKALLLIDEAHSNGVLGPAGRGIGHHFTGVDPNDVDLWMGTLSKSFASCGGYIAGSKALVRYLKYTAPGFVYSAGITPPNAASALKALELMHRHPEVVERLRQRSRLFLELARSKGIDTGHAIGAAVIPAIVGNSLDCMKLSEALAARRINVQPIVYPAVEDNASRLRFFLSATHSEEELRHTADVLAEELRRVREASASQSSVSI